jgi:transcription antitermination factor NusG
MSSDAQVYQIHSAVPSPATECVSWYALSTRARHEKVVDRRLHGQGITTFLPVVREIHRWQDRRKVVELPLFSCYVFVKLAMSPQQRVRVYQVDGILGFVGSRGQGTPIPDEQIEAVRTLLSQNLPWSSHPFLKAGQRVRIRGGVLDGLEGIFLSRNGDRTLVISVDAIQRSLSVRIEGYDVEAL